MGANPNGRIKPVVLAKSFPFRKYFKISPRSGSSTRFLFRLPLGRPNLTPLVLTAANPCLTRMEINSRSASAK